MSMTLKALIPLIITVSNLSRVLSQTASAREPRQCGSIEIQQVTDSSILPVGRVLLKSYDDKSTSLLTVHNTGALSIESALVLVDFLDSNANHLETGLYFATTHRSSEQLMAVQREFGVQKLLKPIEPGEDLDLSAVSDVVLPGCPFKGVVSRTDVRFSGGTKWSQSSPTWMTEPVFREATVDMSTFPKTIPTVFWASVELDADGKASVIETDESSGELRAWFQKQLDGWLIIPGDRGPLASSTQQLAMLVRVAEVAQIK